MRLKHVGDIFCNVDDSDPTEMIMVAFEFTGLNNVTVVWLDDILTAKAHGCPRLGRFVLCSSFRKR